MAYHHGYVRVERDGRRVMLHRWLMEQRLGRKLEIWEFVHHKDRDKLNNAIDNLELVIAEDHTSFHMAGEPNKKPTGFRPWNALSSKVIGRIHAMRANGSSYSQIARALNINSRTVRTHVVRAAKSSSPSNATHATISTATCKTTRGGVFLGR